MKAKKKTGGASGFTLIELMVSLFIFGLLMAIMYPTFNSISTRVNELSDKQAMTQKGQRVMNYMGEEFRLAGLFIGANPSLTFCGEATATDSIMSSTSVTILTSERITTTQNNVPFLATSVFSGQGNNVLTVNVLAPTSVSAITFAPGTAGNARAFITFDTLKPNIGALVYQVTNFTGNQLTIMRNNNPALGLEQDVNMLSNAYSIIRKNFSVSASRSLQVTRSNVVGGVCQPDSEDLVSSWGPGNNNGGIDGFEVEYMLGSPTSNTVGAPQSALTAADVVNVRAVVFWLLLRSDFPSKDYLDTSTYTLGTKTAGPFNDAYRRVLMTKTVEVRNVRL